METIGGCVHDCLGDHVRLSLDIFVVGVAVHVGMQRLHRNYTHFSCCLFMFLSIGFSMIRVI